MNSTVLACNTTIATENNKKMYVIIGKENTAYYLKRKEKLM